MAALATKTVRVRIAPSPTGPLHVGTARTALFNELFARQHRGSLVVRIEDTDRARSQTLYEEDILAGLHWLGISWQEGPDVGGSFGPYRQSERVQRYASALKHLLNARVAYQPAGSSAVVLKVQPQAVRFSDLVRGTVTTHSNAWGGDFVIAKSLTEPLYHLAVVVDDAAMHITHIIRGEDHLSNTARQILLQQALGYPTPQYAHLPLLLDEQRRKLSKRSSETSLLAYRDRGYLPEAMLNYLALLGWNPKTEQEIFSHEELVQAFRLADVQKSGAIFSHTKLTALNRHYVRALPPRTLLARIRPWLRQVGVPVDDQQDFWTAALLTERDRADTLPALAEAVCYFTPGGPPHYPAERLVWRDSDVPATREALAWLTAKLEALPPLAWQTATLKDFLMRAMAREKKSRGEILWPLRVALTGREHSPGPFEVAAVLGKDETARRLARALTQLS